MQGWLGSHHFHPDTMQHPDLIKGQGVVIFGGKMVVTRFRNKLTVKMSFVKGDRERFKYKLFFSFFFTLKIFKGFSAKDDFKNPNSLKLYSFLFNNNGAQDCADAKQ